ncbi:MAG: hypothetical protein ACOZCL_14090 [Bacillota bacterium]
MEKLRVIAVERVYVSGHGEREPALACVYKNDKNKLYVYDTYGKAYYQKEYFKDFEGLIFHINKGKYEWTDFEINSGELLTRDSLGDIFANEERVEKLTRLITGKFSINDETVQLFYKFLQKLNKNDSRELADIQSAYASGELKKDIQECIESNPLEDLRQEDLEIIVRSRLEGIEYVKNKLRQLSSGNDPLKLEEITFYFTRLFKLQHSGYINFD